MKASSGLRKFMLDGGSFKAAMDGCTFKTYSGAVPEYADDPIVSGTNELLSELFNGNDGSTPLTFESAATIVQVGGATIVSIDKNAAESWGGANVLGGTAAFFRLELPADDQASSIIHPRVQGTIATAGADVNFTSGVTLVAAAVQNLDFFNVILPTA
jgi:hypothetical protein